VSFTTLVALLHFNCSNGSAERFGLAAERKKLPPTNALAAKKILSRITRGVKGTVICQCTLVSVHDGSITYGRALSQGLSQQNDRSPVVIF
jgi:hypothetical protein